MKQRAVLIMILVAFSAATAFASVRAAWPVLPAGTSSPEPENGSYDDGLPGKGKFLVASRMLADPRFRETVVLLIDYSPRGATGIIINRPLSVKTAELLPSVPGLRRLKDSVYFGGPVEANRLMLLFRADQQPPESSHIFGKVYFSSSRNTLKLLAEGNAKTSGFHLYAGYAGWVAGQLDREIARGDWYSVNAESGPLFDMKPEAVWSLLIRQATAIQVRIDGGSLQAQARGLSAGM